MKPNKIFRLEHASMSGDTQWQLSHMRIKNDSSSSLITCGDITTLDCILVHSGVAYEKSVLTWYLLSFQQVGLMSTGWAYLHTLGIDTVVTNPAAGVHRLMWIVT